MSPNQDSTENDLKTDGEHPPLTFIAKIFIAVFLLVFLLVALTIWHFHTKEYVPPSRAEYSGAAPATITKTQFDECGGDCKDRTDIYYQYTVNGVVYEKELRKYGGGDYGDEYPVGSQRTYCYKPNSPTEGYLLDGEEKCGQ